MWDIDTGECRQTLEAHSAGVISVGITPDGRTAISGSVDKTVRCGVRCVVWLWGVFIRVMWRLRAVWLWFVYLSCVRYWCTSTIDLWNVCVCDFDECFCVLCGCYVLLSGHMQG